MIHGTIYRIGHLKQRMGAGFSLPSKVLNLKIVNLITTITTHHHHITTTTTTTTTITITIITMTQKNKRETQISSEIM